MMLDIVSEGGVKSQKKIDVITKRRDAIKIGAKKKSSKFGWAEKNIVDI